MSKLPRKTESAGGVVLNRDGLVLIVNQHGTSWSLPKGHIEPGEDHMQAAEREIAEESGVIQLDYVKPLGDYTRYRIGKDGGEDRSEFKKIYMYLFRTTQQTLEPSDPQNPEARWVKKSDVAQFLTHPKDREFYLRIMDQI